jgi:signal transduction histidine kinase/CheY-like chemotaxis protein/HPt (histidine-containing phosphotransfer) domain-containing protein
MRGICVNIITSTEAYTKKIKEIVEGCGCFASTLKNLSEWEKLSECKLEVLIVEDRILMESPNILRLRQILVSYSLPVMVVSQTTEGLQSNLSYPTPIQLDELPAAIKFASQQVGIKDWISAFEAGATDGKQTIGSKDYSIDPSFLDKLPLLIATVVDNKFTFINQYGVKLLGFSHPGDMLGKPWSHYVPHEIVENCPLQGKEGSSPEFAIQSFEFTMPNPYGEEITLNLDFTFSSVDGTQIVQLIAKDITKEKHIQELLSREATLIGIDLAIHQSTELPTILKQICITATQALEVKLGVCILLPSKAENTFWTMSSNMDGFDASQDSLVDLAKDPLIGWISKNKKPLVITDITQSEYTGKQLVYGMKFRSIAGVPLLEGENLLGILFLMDDRSHQFKPEDIEFLTKLSNRATLSITKNQYLLSLKESKIEAEKTARWRMEYLANMSHELRAPLAAINHLSALLADTPMDQTQTDYLTSIQSSTDRLLVLIGDVLDFARLEASKLELKVKEFNLIQVLDGAFDMIALLAAQKNLDMTYIIDEDVPEVLVGDPYRLSQILTNLLTNAVKFTNSGNIVVEVRLSAEQLNLIYMVDGYLELVFKVQDTGIGIPKESQVNLFKPFSQLNKSEDITDAGTGLGLVICKQLVQLMQGDIWVESEGVPGKGSNFYFTMQCKTILSSAKPLVQRNRPVFQGKVVYMVGQPSHSWIRITSQLTFWGMKVHSFTDPKSAITFLGTNPALDIIILDENSISPEADKQLQETFGMISKNKTIPVLVYIAADGRSRSSIKQITTNFVRRPYSLIRLYRILKDSLQLYGADTKPVTLDSELNILVTDDDPISRTAILLHLEHLGYSADIAVHGDDALAAFSNKHYHLLIIDMHMGATDGLSTTRTIRNTLPAEKQPFIVILTAGTTSVQLSALQNIGMDAYLEKPVSIERLRQVLEQVGMQKTVTESMPNKAPRNDSAGGVSTDTIDTRILHEVLEISRKTQQTSTPNIFDLFFLTTPKLMEQVKTSADENKIADLIANLHALRGSCEVYGAVQLSLNCKKLEKALGKNEEIDIQAEIGAIETEYLKVKNTLLTYRPENDPENSTNHPVN